MVECGGLPYGGELIGYCERSLIYIAFCIVYSSRHADFVYVLNYLSFIIAGKTIFRFSSRDRVSRECIDWYILDTFLSITLGLSLSWIYFSLA